MSTSKPAVLALEDGSIFRGLAFGADATIAGECVFNTSMTGYQEILTDPSYFGQIVTMTAVQIGNYGICPADTEAAGPKASGFVVRELSPIVSNWRSQLSLDAYLRQHGIPGISEIDTRALTKKLRVDGAMKCCLSTLPLSEAEAVARARGWQPDAGGAGRRRAPAAPASGAWRPGRGLPACAAPGPCARGRSRRFSRPFPTGRRAASAPR